MSAPAWLRETAEGVEIDVVVSPRASATRAVGVHGDRLKVQVAAPPVDGAANTEVVRYFAALLDVPKSAVELRSGATGRRKTLRVAGVEPERAIEVLR